MSGDWGCGVGVNVIGWFLMMRMRGEGSGVRFGVVFYY